MSLVHLLVEPKTLKDALERLSRRGFEPSSSTPVASDRAVDACNLRFLRRRLNSGPLRQTLLELRQILVLLWCLDKRGNAWFSHPALRMLPRSPVPLKRGSDR